MSEELKPCPFCGGKWQIRLLARLADENKCDIDELVAQIVQEWIMAGKGAR